MYNLCIIFIYPVLWRKNPRHLVSVYLHVYDTKIKIMIVKSLDCYCSSSVIIRNSRSWRTIQLLQIFGLRSNYAKEKFGHVPYIYR